MTTIDTNIPFYVKLLSGYLSSWKKDNPGKRPFVSIKIFEYNDEFEKGFHNKMTDQEKNKVKPMEVEQEIKTSFKNIVREKKLNYTRVKKTTGIWRKTTPTITKTHEWIEVNEDNIDINGSIQVIKPEDMKYSEVLVRVEDHYKRDCVLSYDNHNKYIHYDSPYDLISENIKVNVKTSIRNMLPKMDKNNIILIHKLGKGNFGTAYLSVLDNNRRTHLIYKECDTETELEGIKITQMIKDSPLKALYYVEDKNDICGFLYPFYPCENLTEEVFWNNIHNQIKIFKALGISHNDIRDDNIDFNGFLIDNGLCTYLPNQPSKLHSSLRGFLSSGRIDNTFDERCFSALSKNLYSLKKNQYNNLEKKLREKKRMIEIAKNQLICPNANPWVLEEFFCEVEPPDCIGSICMRMIFFMIPILALSLSLILPLGIYVDERFFWLFIIWIPILLYCIFLPFLGCGRRYRREIELQQDYQRDLILFDL